MSKNDQIRWKAKVNDLNLTGFESIVIRLCYLKQQKKDISYVWIAAKLGVVSDLKLWLQLNISSRIKT